MAVSIFWLGPNVLAAYKFTNLAFFFETWSAWLIFLVSLYETTLKIPAIAARCFLNVF